MSQTLYDKLWDSHVVDEDSDGNSILYIDRHLINEVTSPQAFEGLKLSQRTPWRPQSIIATADHNTPTDTDVIDDKLAEQQVKKLDSNILETGALAYFPFRHEDQGIVHIVAPELGITQPGMTIVCGDSHTSTHGAFGALAFGIGTTDVEHVLATQTLQTRKSKNFKVNITGRLPKGTYAKDLALAVVGRIGASGAVGHVLEFSGGAISEMSMEARMTLCNMSIEAGARAGLIGVDETTVRYLRGKRYTPPSVHLADAEAYWQTFVSDPLAQFDKAVDIDVACLKPIITWGTSPDMQIEVDGCVPNPDDEADPLKRQALVRALRYMGLTPHSRPSDMIVDKVFFGSCTNARIEDLRVASSMVKGNQVAKSVQQAIVVPGSGAVKRQAEEEGLHEIFLSAGFEWRAPGCSMCLGMNADRLNPGERCASTSNRNFEGRQGSGGRTHLVSPVMAVLAAIHGRFVDAREYIQ
ncbi:3-isopropylmalate dehydratase large subunit [Pseudomonas sp. NGC7]|uniref:3-isopropylmalate dehydratase large subunit n=1 Tax=Pseudomonas sp. NGC7 TaxID=3341775 RepID=UPI0037DBCE57